MAEKRKIGDWIESGYLGSGTFGVVKLWFNEATEEKIALKICRNDPPMKEKNKERWRQEVEFLKQINHPNIIQTRNFPLVLANHLCNETSLPALCMEYCEGGDLRKTLSTAENCCGLKETMIIRVCEDIANAIECLHKENIAHRDLKPENIVICPRGNKNTYKVIDLGYAKQADQAGLCHSFVGTQFYLAPEILTRQKYTLNVDLWSFGILLYECCTGIRPFPSKNFQALYGSMSSKEQNIIAVVEEEKDVLVYREKLPEVNRLNCVLQRKFEKLLRLLLDGKPTRRGSCEATKKTWRDCVNEIINTKVIEVFCFESYQQFVYELTSNLSLQDLKTYLQKDTGIPVEHQELFIHDGSDLPLLAFPNSNLMAFMFNKAFVPTSPLKYSLKHKDDLPKSLVKMLDDPEGFSKKSKHMQEVFKHSVFFIHKQITKNKCLSRGLKALLIRLLKWSRPEFAAGSEAVNQRVTRLRSVVDFFQLSLATDLKNVNSKGPALKNNVFKDLADFEAWERVEKEMDLNSILRKASEILKKKTELQNKIATMKNNEHVSKTPERSKMRLEKWSKEIQSRYEEMKASLKKQEDKSSFWKEKTNAVQDTMKMVLKDIENINGEFYQFLIDLFMLRRESENFIPSLKRLEMRTIELQKRVEEWQRKRQEQIWQLFFVSSGDKEVAKDEKCSQTQERSLPITRSKRRSSGVELVKHSQALLSRVKDTLKDAKNQQDMFKNQIEDLDWSFCDVIDSEDKNKNNDDT